jgi:hypothetical protein
MKLNVRRNCLSNITSYASYPFTVGFFCSMLKEKSFHLRELGLLMSQVSARQIISISLGIEFMIGLFRHHNSKKGFKSDSKDPI